jgi:hypothetical protein
VAYVSPNFFQRKGNPVCECDQDMTYLYTEVVDESEGEDGDLAFVETMDKDDIPELMEVKEKEITFDFCFSVKSKKNWEDLTGEELKQALLDRIKSLDINEYREACGFVGIIFKND